MNFFLRYLLFLVLAIPVAAARPDALAGKIRQIAESEAMYCDFSGVVCVAQGDTVVYQGAFGYANRDFQVPNTLLTKFNIGSITKTLTALAVVQLSAQGKIDVRAPLAAYLPDCPIPEKAEITIDQLLTHSSGLYDFSNSDVIFELLQDKRSISDFIPYVYGRGLLFKPGSDVSYSSGGYVLLGAVVEKVTGKSYGQYIRDSILEPAGMPNSAILFAEDVSPNKAEGYKPVGRGRFLNRKLLDFPGSSAGGLFTTASDLWNYVRALWGNRLLSREYRELLLAPKSKEAAGRGKAAYGWWRDSINGRDIVYHTGGTPGFSSNLTVFPESGHVAIVLSNSWRGTTGIADAINAAITGGFYEPADQNTLSLRKAVDAYYNGDPREALRLIDEILASDKPSRRAYYFSAVSRLALNIEPQKALLDLDRFIALTDPGLQKTLSAAWLAKGEILEKSDRPEDALAAYRKSLELDPGEEKARAAIDRLKKVPARGAA